MILQHSWLTLKLNFRNRLAILYGFAFPLLFLAAFLALYRHEPIALHMGELLTVTVLGGACFGLPTALVSERERGVWRHYRLTPASTPGLLAAVLLARLVLIGIAGLLQLTVAMALGMAVPADPPGLLLAFTATCFAFMGLGLMIAMLADSVPAVQALGQCIFLPMLIIGGIAVPLASLPDWAQHVSGFFPGRYAVEAMQAAIRGGGSGLPWFPLAALLATGLSAGTAAILMVRWDRRSQRGGGRLWTVLALLIWVAVGLAAERRGEVVAPDADAQAMPPPASYLLPPAAGPAGPAARAGWQEVTDADLAEVAFERLPDDRGIVAPVALFDEAPAPEAEPLLAQLAAGLPAWRPGHEADPEQRVRNLLCVAAVPDLLQMESIERFVPVLLFQRIRAEVPHDKLVRILYWIAFHPDGGDLDACRQLAPLGLPVVTGDTSRLRPRIMLYALKLLGRITGDIVQK